MKQGVGVAIAGQSSKRGQHGFDGAGLLGSVYETAHGRGEMTAESQVAKPTGPGQRLREVRTLRGLSVRELARRAGCSASSLSQVERDMIAPSARIVYALASELGISLDYLFGSEEIANLAPAQGVASTTAPPPGTTEVALRGDPSWGRATGPDGEGIVQRASDREVIPLASGIRWERLTPRPDPNVDFLDVVYEPGGRSSESDQAVRHGGREYLRVLEGEIEAVIGFETVHLGVGDSLAFDPSIPHQYRNSSDVEPARCLSVIVHYLS